MKTAGIVLVIAGIVMLIFTGFKYVTRDKVADIGPVEINKKETHNVNWTPVTGGILLIGGFLLLTASSKGKGHS
jgi:hypothetical protein